jgi:hypothetical protein
VSDGVWVIVSILGLGAAAVLLLTGQVNAAFVAATLGAVAWFLNYRSRIRPATPPDGGAEDDSGEDDADDGGDSDGDE